MFKMSYFDPVFSTRSIQEKSPSSEFIQIGNYIYRKSQVDEQVRSILRQRLVSERLTTTLEEGERVGEDKGVRRNKIHLIRNRGIRKSDKIPDTTGIGFCQ